MVAFTEAFLREQVYQEVCNDFSFLLTEIIEPRVLQPAQFQVIEELYRIIHREQRVQDYADKQFLYVNYLSSVISQKTGKPRPM